MTDNAKCFEDIENSGSQLYKNFKFEEEHIVIPMTTVSNDQVIVPLQNENTVVPLQVTDTVHPELDPANKVKLENSQPQVPRRSTKKRRSTIANDYIVYLQKHEFDIGLEDDSTSLNEAKLSIHSTKWSNAIKDELKFMKDNDA